MKTLLYLKKVCVVNHQTTKFFKLEKNFFIVDEELNIIINKNNEYIRTNGSKYSSLYLLLLRIINEEILPKKQSNFHLPVTYIDEIIY